MKIADKAKLLLPAGYDEGLLLLGCYREASDGGKPVKSVTRGDFSVTYGDVVQDALLGYNGRLNAFRKMKW